MIEKEIQNINSDGDGNRRKSKKAHKSKKRENDALDELKFDIENEVENDDFIISQDSNKPKKN